MPKALSITHAGFYRCLPHLARGATLAAALILALGAGAAAASVRPSDRASVPPPAEEAAQRAGWEYSGSHLRLQRVVPRVHRHGLHRHGTQRHEPHKRHELHRQWHGHKKLRQKRFEHGGRRHYGLACRPVKVVGWHRGHRALFGQVVCINRFGQRSTLRGSRYLIRYLHH